LHAVYYQGYSGIIPAEVNLTCSMKRRSPVKRLLLKKNYNYSGSYPEDITYKNLTNSIAPDAKSAKKRYIYDRRVTALINPLRPKRRRKNRRVNNAV